MASRGHGAGFRGAAAGAAGGATRLPAAARLPAVSIFLILGALAAGCPRETPAAGSAARVAAGRLENKNIKEASGLAPSLRSSGVLWVHNDSGNEPALYAIGADGRHLGTVWLAGTDNMDWEDMASFTLGGKAHLLVADTGDNRGKRKSYTLYVMEEPDAALLSRDKEHVAPPAWEVTFVYPDGAHDCEAVAVDPGVAGDGSDGRVYLLLKRTTPPRLFSVPLKPAVATPGEPLVAWELGRVALPGRPSALRNLLPAPAGRYRGMPTGMDFSQDGRRAVVLTYGDVFLYSRREGESWFSALVRDPVALPPHKLGQAEAVCFSADGKHIFVTEEKTGAALLRYDLEE